MAIIKIINDNNSTSTSYLLGYTISAKKDESENVRFLEINTSISLFKYRIWTEVDITDIDSLVSFISDMFDNTIKNNTFVNLKEDSRGFISISDSDEPGKKFGGSRL